MSNYQSLIESKLDVRGVSGNNVIYVCPNPNCGDTSGHLYVDYVKNKWHCFHCNIGGRSISSLLRYLNIYADYDYEGLYRDRDKSLDEVISLSRINKTEKVVEYSTDLNILTMYYLNHVKLLSPAARKYLHHRGISDEMITYLCISEGINRYGETLSIGDQTFQGRDYSGRIMIPSLRKDGTISYYLGRDYTNTKPNKYSNAPQEIGVASEDVWSLDIINSRIIIICEGVMTAISVNRALGKTIACATYGKSIAKNSSNIDVRVTSQGEKLLNKKFDTYIMFYDKDALDESWKSAKYLYDRGANVRVVQIPEDMYGPKADANDMTDEEIRDLIQKSVPFDPLSDISKI